MKNQSKTLTKFIYSLKLIRYNLFMTLIKKNFDDEYERLTEIYRLEPIAFLEKAKDLSTQKQKDIKELRRNIWNVRKNYKKEILEHTKQR